MADARSLLRAVITDPDSDAPRLVYADWLEGQGDVDRARFIRVQCAIAQGPDDGVRMAALQQHEAELLGQFGYRWAEEFGDQISVWVYRRGFIERVEMRLEAPAERIRLVLDRAPIRHIRDLSQLDDLGGVIDALPDLIHLTGLEFWGLYGFDDRQLARILSAPELAGLRTLILHHDRNGNLAKEQVLVDALQSPLRANLRELAMNVDGSWRGPSPRVVQAMARSRYLTRLRKLDLSSARLSRATVEAIGRSAALAGLVELDLGRCRLTERAWQAVLRLPQLPNLGWLRLHNARLVDASGRYQGDLRELPHYANAFAATGAKVDWDSEYISPYFGGTWTGMSWRARRQAPLFGMSRFLREQDYDELEADARRDCLLNGGLAIARAIGALPFDEYQHQLGFALDLALSQMSRSGARALFLRIRPDLGWRGTFDIQGDPPPDTWEPFEEYSHTMPVDRIAAPDFHAAATIFTSYPFGGTIHPSGPAQYLIARTLAAFGRLLRDRQLPVPVWFSCVWAAFRLR